MSNKTRKVFGICLIFGLILIAFSATVLATTYPSYLDMDANSWHRGSKNSYAQRNHSISFCPQSLPTGRVNLDITLVRNAHFATSEVHNTTATMTKTGNITYSYGMGNHATDGTYNYEFETDNAGGIYADPVIMSSY